jgi:tetratricopeptide (TPR) repeat protein
LSDLSRFDEAENHYKRALELKEDYPDVHNSYATLLNKLSRFDEAENHYKRALELKEDYPEARANLGFLYLQQGKIEDALQSMYEALKLRESLPDEGTKVLSSVSMLVLGIAKSKVSLKKKQGAINTIKQAMQNILDKSTYQTFINETVQQLQQTGTMNTKQLMKIVQDP